MNTQTLSPMIRQSLYIKAKYPDVVLLFRVGDFYEAYGDDAKAVSDVCAVTLTCRTASDDSKMQMAGFPHYALDTYLPKLVRAGKRVAICDQLEDPKMTKKLVKRGITEKPAYKPGDYPTLFD